MADPSRTPVEVVSAWHDAVNAGRVDDAVALASDDVIVSGPGGTSTGRDVMRRWLERTGIRLEPQEQLREEKGHVLVHEQARWTTAAAPEGAPTTPTDTWVVFTARDGLLDSVARYETEQAALEAVGAVS